MGNSISQFIDKNFVPESVYLDKELLKRHRFFLYSAITTFILSFLYVAFFHFINYGPGVVIVWGYIICHVFYFIMCKKGVSLFVIGNCFACMTFVGFSYSAATSGGVSSAVVAWHLATKVSSFWYSGKKSGMFWSITTILTISGLFIAEGLGHEFPTLYDEQYKYLFSGTMHVGVLIYYVVVLKVYEGWKDKSIEELEKLIAEKEKIVRVVAHDLRNPLTIMNLKITNLARKIQRNEAQNPEVTLKSLNKEIKRIISISELILPQNKQTTSKFNIVETVKSLVGERFSSMAENKDIKISISSNEDEINVVKNVTTFERLLDNLLSNAIKYSPKDTTVSLDINHKENFIVIKLTDEGLGFSSEEIEVAFNEFSNISNKPTAGEKSHGLGLSIVKDLASQMGATISLNSEGKNKGSCFTITMPLDE